MHFFFTYSIRNRNQILRIGKGRCFAKSNEAITKYIVSRYRTDGWTTSDINWHFSESAALKKERQLLDDYFEKRGTLPVWNQRRGGGGRQIYVKCKSFTAGNLPCPNDARAGNYNYCGIHRRQHNP